MTVNRTHVMIANSFGALGYFSAMIQWLWAFVIVGYPLISHDRLSFLLPKPSETPPPPSIEYGGFTPIVMIIAVIFTLCIIGLTIYALIRLPATIGRKGSIVTHHTASAITPLIAKKHTTKMQQRLLSYRLTWWVKASLVLIPLLALVFASAETGLDRQVVATVGGFCAVCSALYFLIQRAIQWRGKLPPADMW